MTIKQIGSILSPLTTSEERTKLPRWMRLVKLVVLFVIMCLVAMLIHAGIDKAT